MAADDSVTTAGHAGDRRAFGRWCAALALLCLLTLWLQFRNIDGTMPYPQHVDEPFVAGPAQATIQTGTLHPRIFNYPSLPKYLASLGMAAGFIRGAARGEVADVTRLGNFGYPYYDSQLPMQTARQLFAVLGLLAVVATGLTAWWVARRPAAIFTAPLLLVATPLYFSDSWRYLNVDIIAACFATLTVASVMLGTHRRSSMALAVVPGALAGLATGGKYTLAVVFAPVVVGILLFGPHGQRGRMVAMALAALVGAFLIAVPYSLIDSPGFLNGVAAEAFHYATGHRGFQAEPGWPQIVFYGRHFLSEFGAAAPMAVLGGGVLAWRDWRRTIVLAALPVTLLALLVGQRVHFERNVLSLHPPIAVCAAVGAAAAFDWVVAAVMRRRERTRAPLWLRWGVAGGILALTMPWWNAATNLMPQRDSRNVGEAWLLQKLPAEWSIVVPAELAFDTRDLEAAGRRVIKARLAGASDEAGLMGAMGAVQAPAVVLLPRWGADERYPGVERAQLLNNLTSRWRVIERFGSRDVLVNYSYPNPSGDPAFAVAVLK